MKKSTKILSIVLLFTLGFAKQSFAQPVANFSWTPQSPCVGGTIQVTDMSTPQGSITAWIYSVTGATSPTYAVPNPIITFTASGVQTMSLLVFQGATPSSVTEKSITIKPNPTITVVSSETVALCPGSTATLSASGASTYVWAAPLTSTASTATISPVSSSSYAVVGTNSNGCVSTGTITQNVTPNPINVSTTKTLLCVGETATLTAIGNALTYSWAPVTSSVSTAVISPTATTNYSVYTSGTVCPTYTWTTAFTQNVSACTGVQSVSADKHLISVYPNPATSEIVIEFTGSSSKKIAILDVTGRVVTESSTNLEKLTVNLNSLAQGIYYVRVQSGNSTEVVKIVKL